jgi:ribosomal protein L10
MVNLKNKYLLKTFEDKFLNYDYLMVCHLFYLSILESNLLRFYCKKHSIVCFSVKNKIIIRFLKNYNFVKINSLFQSQNILFFSNSFSQLNEFYNVIKLEKTKLIPLVFISANQVSILTNKLVLNNITKKSKLYQITLILNFLIFFRLLFLIKLQYTDLLFFYQLQYANSHPINKKGKSS